jgi:hypothetical protein
MLLRDGQENPPEYDDYPEVDPIEPDGPDQDITMEHVSIGGVLMMKGE